MCDVEFCLKSMCFMPYTRVVVREMAPGSAPVPLGSGYYDKVMRKFGTRKVVRSYVSGDSLFMDVSPVLESCSDFVCSHKDSCIMNECLGHRCPLCRDGALCTVCLVRRGCRR